jgi:hypothetical protein
MRQWGGAQELAAAAEEGETCDAFGVAGHRARRTALAAAPAQRELLQARLAADGAHDAVSDGVDALGDGRGGETESRGVSAAEAEGNAGAGAWADAKQCHSVRPPYTPRRAASAGAAGGTAG